MFMDFDFLTNCDREFIEREIVRFKGAERRRVMLMGEDYFAGQHDILHLRRAVIGEKGELEPVYNLPDNKAVDNQYRKLITQKTNYLLGQPLSFQAGDSEYYKTLMKLFDKKFMRMMKNVCKDSYNHGIAWVYPYYGEGGLKFKQLKGYEVIPGWRDFEHTELDYAIRIYEVVDYSRGEKIVERVEVFGDCGIHYFELCDDKLIDTEPFFKPYITEVSGGGIKELDWGGRIPLIAFKRDSSETPLIGCVKSLQDGLNMILSNFWNCMEECVIL